MDHDFANVRRGALLSPAGKTRITIYLDDDVLSHFRERATVAGRGYQTVINATLRECMAKPRVVNVIDVQIPDGWHMPALRGKPTP